MVSTSVSAHARSAPASEPAPTWPGRVAIENVSPAVDGGRWPAKRLVGEAVIVEADIFSDGHDVLDCDLVWRGPGAPAWRRTIMRMRENDRWRGTFTPQETGRHQFTIEAWRDPFASWTSDVTKKLGAGQNVDVEIIEGMALVAHAQERAPALHAHWRALNDPENDEQERLAILLSTDLIELMREHGPRAGVSRCEPDSPCGGPQTRRFLGVVRALSALRVERSRTAWNVRRRDRATPLRQGPGLRRSLFHADSPDRPHQPQGPQQCARRHGRRSRQRLRHRRTRGRARRHSPAARRRWPTSNGWFAKLRGTGSRSRSTSPGNARPIIPGCRQHPEWFEHRPDGSIKYAENPPKKYEDIVNIEFDGDALPRCLARAARRHPFLGRRMACASSASTIRTPSRCRSGSG